MFPKRFALISGIVLLAAGVLALIPSMVGVRNGLPALNIENSYGLFLGMFPLNIVNKVMMIVVGLAGIAASRARFTSLPKSILYARVLFYGAGILTILGLIESTNTLFGYWPLFGDNLWASGFLTALGAIYGYALSSKVDSVETHRKQMRTAHSH